MSDTHCLMFCVLHIKHNMTAVSDSSDSFILNKTDKIDELRD